MRVLAIETASEACSIALFDGDTLLARDHRVLGRGHAEHLIPMIAELPDKGRADRILVSLGPGSFTGVRVGLAAARALGFAWASPVLGYHTLQLVHLGVDLPEPQPLTVCMNGGHGEWFVQNFAANGTAQNNERSLTPDQVQAEGTHGLIVGNRAKECAALFEDERIAIEALPDAGNALRLAESHLSEDLSPIYGRAPDATPQKVAQTL